MECGFRDLMDWWLGLPEAAGKRSSIHVIGWVERYTSRLQVGSPHVIRRPARWCYTRAVLYRATSLLHARSASGML